MTTWDEIASDGEALVERVETLIASERWDELSTSTWSIDTIPDTPITDAERLRIISLMEVSSRLCRDVAVRMSSARTNIDDMPMLRKASTAYISHGTS
ncbi:hypothetical protein BMS3Bbin02_01842 [bacterium BMS3Bbin02]|nr:hypothetical protein BMS3Bbin02_01842 [bacterium BMS3Bbin02]